MRTSPEGKPDDSFGPCRIDAMTRPRNESRCSSARSDAALQIGNMFSFEQE